MDYRSQPLASDTVGAGDFSLSARTSRSENPKVRRWSDLPSSEFPVGWGGALMKHPNTPICQGPKSEAGSFAPNSGS